MADQSPTTQKKYGLYTCIRRISLSGNSSVYYAVHQNTGKLYALRTITVSNEPYDDAVAACKTELAKFARLDTPNIVPMEDFGSEGAEVFMVMKAMKGGSLRDRMRLRQQKIADGGNMPMPSLGEVVAMLQRLALALDDLHVRDIAHGQVEPGNIMFDDDGNAYLADTGLTRLMKIIYSLDSTSSFNTTKYTAPELWEGERPLPASDQYSLACVAYELMTGRPPFEAPTIFGLMKQHTDDVAMPPHYVRDELPADLAIPFWQAMAKPPERRFPTVQAFITELSNAIKDREGSPTGFFTFEVK